MFLPLEFGVSFLLFTVAMILCPWYFMLLLLPLAVYNLGRYNKKDHKIYFITKKEYKPHYKRMELQF